ncbi:MAG: alpha/beta fold hydrolase [Rhodospirillales bacterium]|nr:alpha/beta fold hydrolase [Rhodospirillales bacterium]
MLDGAVLPYEIRGGDDASGRRIVLIHSLAMNMAFWQPVAERLAAGAEVLTYDCRGHGRASKASGPYTVELFADDLAALLDSLSWETALIAGASMGGSVALAFAARHSARTRALGLIDTTAWYGDDAPAAWEGRAQRALKDGLGSLLDFQTTRWFSDGFRATCPEVVDEAVSAFLANDLQAYVESCRMLGALDVRRALPTLRMPVRIVVGEEDYGTPPSASEAMRSAIPGATMRVISGARHLTPLEVPGEVAAELEVLADAAFADSQRAFRGPAPRPRAG